MFFGGLWAGAFKLFEVLQYTFPPVRWHEMTAILLQGFLNEIAQPMINSVELLRARASGAVPRRAQAAGWRGGVPYPHAPLHTPCSGSWEQAGGVCDLDLEGRLLQSL